MLMNAKRCHEHQKIPSEVVGSTDSPGEGGEAAG